MHCRADVHSNRQLNPSHYLITIKPEKALPVPSPGQFFMLGIHDRLDPLLKRPFGLFSSEDGLLTFLYRVRGKGTLIMSGLVPGDPVEILGPLGNPYPLPEGKDRKKKPLLVAGGTGVASLFPLLHALKENAMFIYGGRNRDELLCIDELKGVAKDLRLATQDGSEGKHGTAVDIVIDLLRGKDGQDFLLYACGPTGMLKALQGLGLKGYFAMEENMACGTGVCLGCAVKTRSGYKRACTEGPVFDLNEVIFERL